MNTRDPLAEWMADHLPLWVRIAIPLGLMTIVVCSCVYVVNDLQRTEAKRKAQQTVLVKSFFAEYRAEGNYLEQLETKEESIRVVGATYCGEEWLDALDKRIAARIGDRKQAPHDELPVSDMYPHVLEAEVPYLEAVCGLEESWARLNDAFLLWFDESKQEEGVQPGQMNEDVKKAFELCYRCAEISKELARMEPTPEVASLHYENANFLASRLNPTSKDPASLFFAMLESGAIEENALQKEG